MEHADKTPSPRHGPRPGEERAVASWAGRGGVSSGAGSAARLVSTQAVRHDARLSELRASIDASPRQLRQQRRLGTLLGTPAVAQRHPDATSAATGGQHTGLPAGLKSGIESLSGVSLDHVTVHYDSSRPAALNAHAFAQGPDIHLAPGQARHLPHEAWHVVQQAQGRVRPTMQLAGKPVNTDASLEAEADAMGARALLHGGAGAAETLQRRRAGAACTANPVLQGRFQFADDGQMAAWVSKLRDIPSVAGMAEDRDFVVRFEVEDSPDEPYQGYTQDQDGVLVIGLNTARVQNEGQALHALTHELVLHAEAAWADGSLANVLDTDTIRAQHEEIIEQRVVAPDQSLVDGSYRNAQRIVVATLAGEGDYQALGEFVMEGMSEQPNVMLMTLQNHFAHQDQRAPADRQYGRAFTSANLVKARNNVVLAWNDFLQTMQAPRQQHIMQRQLIDMVIGNVRDRKEQVLGTIDEMRQGAAARRL